VNAETWVAVAAALIAGTALYFNWMSTRAATSRFSLVNSPIC
jgi:hypothetical protein